MNNTTALYPDKDQAEVLNQCAQAHNVLSRLTKTLTALVCKFYHESSPDVYRYGFRFDPSGLVKIGDVLILQYGDRAQVVAIVS
jgi:hypothetical protein